MGKTVKSGIQSNTKTESGTRIGVAFSFKEFGILFKKRYVLFNVRNDGTYYIATLFNCRIAVSNEILQTRYIWNMKCPNRMENGGNVFMAV